MATHKQKPKLVVCPVKPTPPGHPQGPGVTVSAEGPAVLTVFENALDLLSDDPFAPPLVVGSQSAAPDENSVEQRPVIYGGKREDHEAAIYQPRRHQRWWRGNWIPIYLDEPP